MMPAHAWQGGVRALFLTLHSAFRMRPLRLLFVFMLCVLCVKTQKAFAQTPDATPFILTWDKQEKVFPTPDHPGTIPAFKGAAIDHQKRLPYFRFRIPDARISNLYLTATTYAAFTPAEQKLFAGAAIGSAPDVYIINTKENRLPVSLVTILPVRRNPQTNQLEKLTSFSYTYTSGQSTQAVFQSIKAANFTSNSVLSAGNWYKLAITETGIHKIDKGVLQKLGIDVRSINPKTIQLFGNGGGMLPQPNSAPRPNDLQENAVMVSGEADGKFDDNDFILFYGQGPHTWQYDAAQKKFSHSYNVYSDTAYYFLRVGYEPGARIAVRGQAAGATQSITTYNERAFYENDLRNMVLSGREWYGEEFSSFNPERVFQFAASGLAPGSELKLTAALMANSSVNSSFAVKLNNQLLGSQSITGRGGADYHPEGVKSTRTYTLNQQAIGNATELKASVQFNPEGNSAALGYLNYLELEYERQLQLYGEQTAFRSLASMNSAVSTFTVGGAPAASIIWDVTTPTRPVLQETSINNGFSFSAPTDVLREFVVFRNTAGIKPTPVGKVANQNLHALNLNGTTDLVIVTHPQFLSEAKRLAEYRSRKSNLHVQVVTTQQIYNEFSSGAQDVTAIRDFMRMVYSRSRKSGDEKVYLLLFGDASYDYKNRQLVNTNFVPVYQSRESLHPIYSYSSEDYYGFLDDEEGEWQEDLTGDHLLDIGIGRLPVKTPSEAAIVVNKIIAYESPQHFGKWRNQITFVADDADFNEHQQDSEFLATYLETTAPVYTSNKVYIDLYPQIAQGNGSQRAPEANAALDKAIEQGSLLINYTGHGNELTLASEQILTMAQIKSWRNKDKLAFLLTATCEFGRYDDPARASGAEAALLHPEGGVIGLLTTTRPVYSFNNRILNRNFFKSAFAGNAIRLGDVMLQTKNTSITDGLNGAGDVNNRNFTLLCDPTLQLAQPALQAQITQFNGKPLAQDTLSALGKVTLAGSILSDAGINSAFTGQLHLTVYEKPVTRYTLGDENTAKMPVQLRENIIYDGKASIKNGLFEVSFVVPKDIDPRIGAGRITLYASNNQNEAMGAATHFLVGGIAKDQAADNTPPTIKVYMQDESFVFGGVTNNNPLLLAKLFDDNGINTAGIGTAHELTATLDGKPDHLIVLNDYYTSEPDTYQEGRIRYNLKDLAPGPHSLKLRAWDTHNNSSEEYIEFIVSNDSKIALEHVLNYPNPFSTKTTFHFDHNRAGETIEIQVQIFTVSGKLIKTLEATAYNSPTHLAALTWNGRDEYNDLLARGVYIYKVNIRSQQDGSKTSKFEKLVILN
ncbi:type IX secretion system sortase PorU [Pontibacter arcticus]|nr:type IX secretion system sortase PorU [Pontibacter arcticus]